MIEYPREPHEAVSPETVKIVGLGGAGTNMLNRVMLDGLEGASLTVFNTDVRTLVGSVVEERIQLGENLTKGLGAGGDPERGNQAAREAEEEIRHALKGRKIVFICVGLGGGTGSGAAPLVARIAREEGAFVITFATMPFLFEGKRRRDQAETALNELAVISNGLVTFDNSRMGELVLAKEGIHKAFAAADRMISESIKAVIRLVVRPGLINIGLDDLMSALRTTRSRCLFGSGIAEGKDRAQKALRNALASPLLDQGALLRDADTVLVHLCGGEDLTLFEIELLMDSLSRHVAPQAHLLFGAAIDPGMANQLSITMISSLPEERLRIEPEPGGFHASAPEDAEPEPDSEKEVLGRLSVVDGGASELDGETETDGPGEADLEESVETGGQDGAAERALEPEPLPRVDEPTAGEEPDTFAERLAKGEEPRDSGQDDAPEEVPVHEATAAAEGPFGEAKDERRRLPFRAKRRVKEEKAKDKPEELFEDLDDGSAVISWLDKNVESGQGQTELELEDGPKGRFEGSASSILDGEDLDIPPFLRHRK